MKVCIAKRYEVEWEFTCIKPEEVAEFVNEINEIAEETAYEYNDGSYYEFDREGLEVVVNNDTATEKTKNFAKYLLEVGDKNNTFVRVEMA